MLINSVLGGNTVSGSSTPKGPNCYENTFTLGNNVIADDSNCFLDDTLASGTVADYLDVDPLLNALADNGGPVYTHSLGDASPARGVANCLSWDGVKVTDDARGIVRDRKCDLGAYEYADARRRRESDVPDEFTKLDRARVAGGAITRVTAS